MDTTLRDRLRALHPGASGRSIKQWLEAGRVRVNGAVVRRGDTPVARADRVELGASPPPPFPAPLRFVHEDDHLLVIDKAPGLLTIADAGEHHRTAYRLLRDWVEATGGPRRFPIYSRDGSFTGWHSTTSSSEQSTSIPRWWCGCQHLNRKRSRSQFIGAGAISASETDSSWISSVLI